MRVQKGVRAKQEDPIQHFWSVCGEQNHRRWSRSGDPLAWTCWLVDSVACSQNTLTPFKLPVCDWRRIETECWKVISVGQNPLRTGGLPGFAWLQKAISPRSCRDRRWCRHREFPGGSFPLLMYNIYIPHWQPSLACCYWRRVYEESYV